MPPILKLNLSPLLRERIVKAALKRVLLVGFQIPWAPTVAEIAILEGYSDDDVARIVVEELAGGEIESVEAAGVHAFLCGALKILGARLPDHPSSLHAWAKLVGSLRQELDATRERLAFEIKQREFSKPSAAAAVDG